MRVVQSYEWAGTLPDLTAAVDAFKAQLAAHVSTEGVPAPWPDVELVGELARSGDTYELAPPESIAPTTAQLQAQQKAQQDTAIFVAGMAAAMKYFASLPDAPPAVIAAAQIDTSAIASVVVVQP